MIDLLHSMSIHHLDLTAGQALSADYAGVSVGADMPPAAIDALLAKLKSVHLDVVSLSGFDLGKTETVARKVFDFGKKLRIKTIVADPAEDSLEMLDKLATEYQINIATGNFQKPELFAGRSKRVGVCVELADWKKYGFSPLDCVQKLKGHILMVHLSDIDARGHETILNSGIVGADQVMAELKDQGFKGICSVEYDAGTRDERMKNFIASVNAFSDIVSKLSGI
jgi:sugar phosphate isomerase/epimerase